MQTYSPRLMHGVSSIARRVTRLVIIGTAQAAPRPNTPERL